jgi:uncharacterized tellurite resistance protein B-like protein
MIIVGTTGLTFTKDKGEFNCPQCGGGVDYRRKKVRCFFTLYFVPLIPMHSLGEYVECQRCQATYHLDILSWDPEAQATQAEAIFMVAVKQVMIAMLLADGVIDDDEVKELQTTFEDLAGVNVTEQDLREEIAVIQAEGSDALELVAQFAPTLNDKGKEILMTAAFQIAVADGHVDTTEKELLEQIADKLQISKWYLKGLLSELEKPAIAG